MIGKIRIEKAQKIVDRSREIISLASRVHYYPIVIKRAKGVMITDVDGNEYVDFLAGAAATNTGHAHPQIVKAIKDQADKFLHTAACYLYEEQQLELAERLLAMTPGSFPKRVQFGLSGADTSDVMIKIARSFTGRQKIIAFLRAYHGCTVAAMTLSSVTLEMRRKMGPLIPEVYHIPFADCYRCIFGKEYPNCGTHCLEFLENLFNSLIPPEEVATLIFEPIQGDAGIIVPPEEFFLELKRKCEEYGILFTAEEVQTGFGRTGELFAVNHWKLEPDIIMLGKGLASGMPLSAVVARKKIMEAWESSAHMSTSASNPLCCAAALATLDVIEKEKLVENSKKLGEYAMKRFRDLKDEHEMIGDIRGKGLMLGIDLVKNRKTKERALNTTKKVCWRSWEQGLILTFFSNSVLRIAPPLVITKEELDKGIDIIDQSMKDVERGKVSDDILQKIIGW